MVDADFNFKMPKIEMTEQSEDGKYGRFVVEPLERGSVSYTHLVLRKYGICRICFRELAYKGQIPGVKKASW